MDRESDVESLPFHHIFLIKFSHLARCWPLLLPDLQPDFTARGSAARFLRDRLACRLSRAVLLENPG